MVQVTDEMGWDCLLPSEWMKLTAVRDLLLPFADHTKTLHSDTYLLPLIVPALLDTHLSQFSLESAHRDLRGLADKINVNLEQYFSCFLFPSEAKFSPLAAAAFFLDPTVAREALIENTDDGIQEKFVLSASTSTTNGEESWVKMVGMRQCRMLTRHAHQSDRDLVFCPPSQHPPKCDCKNHPRPVINRR